MSAYLARLKQLENEKNSHYAPDTVPTKPTEPPFGSFGSTDTAHIDKKIIDDVEMQRERRRAKVLVMLEAAPGRKYAIVVADDTTDPVIVAVAIRGVASFEMAIPKHSYNAMVLLELIERHGLTTH